MEWLLGNTLYGTIDRDPDNFAVCWLSYRSFLPKLDASYGLISPHYLALSDIRKKIAGEVFILKCLLFFRNGGLPRLLHHDDAHSPLLKIFEVVLFTNHASSRIDTRINHRKKHILRLQINIAF
jgi:hypothetical protein